MIFQGTKLPGVFQIEIEPQADERGFFARSWCRREFASHGLNADLAQCSISHNARVGTLRGIHYQMTPYAETKLVRCTNGAVYDVVVDLRRNSPAFKDWIGVTLTASNRSMVYVPAGCAHGFLTLENNTEIVYQISEFYRPELSAGVRWDDPAFQIRWPRAVELLSHRDRSYPDFN